MGLVASLKVRHKSPEVMDQPGLDEAAHRQALEALRRVNALSAGDRAVWPLVRHSKTSVAAREIRGQSAYLTWPPAAETSRSGSGRGLGGRE